MCDVLVLHCAPPVLPSAAVATRLLEKLPYAYRLELERRSEPARLASLAGIALLLEAVRRMRGAPPDLRNLRMFAGSRPALEDGPSFSIAHSATRVAVAASESCEPGLDVEDLGNVGWTMRELERWTATEATLKAMGAGLRDLREVQLDDDLAGSQFRGTRLYLRPVPLVDGCVARLATQTPVSVLTIEEVRWPT
jgi:phosphopantetheinyl transferase